MPIPLRLLILEDQVDDAYLMLRRLQEAGYALEWRRAACQQDYLSQLTPDLDIILADYRLPQFDALHALELLQDRDLDIPFIVVSGAISDEMATECVKRGAADYLLKDRLARLGPAVAGALKDRLERIEKRAAETALEESEQHFRNLFENAPVCLIELDFTADPPAVLNANHQFARLYGYRTPVEVADLPRSRLFTPAALVDMKRMVEAVRSGQRITLETAQLRRDGSVFPARITAMPSRGTGSRRVILSVEDISTEKARRSEEEAIAEERRRIAHEIHDGLAQNLAAMRIQVALWHDLVDQNPAQMHQELSNMDQLLAESIQDVRRSIFALRPIVLDQLGFFPALRQYTQDFGQQHDLQMQLHISGNEQNLSAGLEPALLRIIQESLNNVAKHARASYTWVDLDLKPDQVTLTVRDNGLGFDPSILANAVCRGHLGIKQMQERVEQLGGQHAVWSQPGCGTTVRVSLPTASCSKFKPIW